MKNKEEKQPPAEAIVIVDRSQRIIMISPAGLAMFMYTQEQALGMTLGNLLPPRLRESHQRLVAGFASEDDPERPMGSGNPLVGVRSDGEEFAIEAVIFRTDLAQPSGTQTIFSALVRDVSRQRDRLAMTDHFRHRLPWLFESVPVAICITDSDRVVFANAPCVELLGLDAPSVLLGRSVHEFLDAESQTMVRPHLGAQTTTDEVVILSVTLVNARGDSRAAELVMAALPDGPRRLVQMVLIDLSHQPEALVPAHPSQPVRRGLTARVIEAREEERRRIARELHDEMGQRLAAMKLEIRACLGEHPTPEMAACSQGILAMVDGTLEAARHIASELRPSLLDDLGLVDAIVWHAREFSRRTGIAVNLDLNQAVSGLSSGLATALYRIVQEALTNVHKHAKAQQVHIALKRNKNEIELDIRDDGIGFAPEANHRARPTFGLLGIRERVAVLKGELATSNGQNGGACLSIQIPWPSSQLPPKRGPKGDHRT